MTATPIPGAPAGLTWDPELTLRHSAEAIRHALETGDLGVLPLEVAHAAAAPGLTVEALAAIGAVSHALTQLQTAAAGLADALDRA